MAQFYLIPDWFFGFGIALEFIFGLITLVVAIYSFKVYNYCIERECKIFGWAFLALSMSYFSWAFVSFYIFKLVSADKIFALTDVSGIIAVGVYLHVALFLIGIASLTYMTLNVKNWKVFTLLCSLVLIVPVFSFQKIISLYFVSSLLLFYVLIHYVREFYNKKNPKVLLVLLAFVFLFIGSVDFTFSAINHIPYVVGHVFFLIGYIFIMVNFLMNFSLSRGKKNEKKK